MINANMLSLAKAEALVRSALEFRARRKFLPMAVVVLDEGGNLVAAAREDNASIGRVRVAFGKAYGALALGVGSRTLMSRAETQPYFIENAAAMFDGRLVAVPGGVLAVRDDETLVGAVGVSGDKSDNDELAAIAAIESNGFTPIAGG